MASALGIVNLWSIFTKMLFRENLDSLFEKKVLKNYFLKIFPFFTGWQDIIDTQHKNQGQLYIKIIYKPYVDNFSPNVELACPDTYFPLRKSNRVTLYSCARSLPTKDAAGKSFQSPSLWLDLYSSLVAARKFIYITGWSVNTNIKLLRWVAICFLYIILEIW